MKNMKKLLAVLLAAVMMFSVVSIAASAEDEVEYCRRESCDGVCEWKTEEVLGCITTMALYCKKCGNRSDAIAIENHNWYEYSRIEPTCVEEGRANFACSNNGCYATKWEVLPIEPDAHLYGQWVVTDEPTCNETGSRYQECLRTYEDENGETQHCGYVYTEMIPIDNNAHVFDGEWVVRTEPTCEADGEEFTICTVCKVTQKTKAIPAHSNSWSETMYEVIEEPSCIRDGSMKVVCTKCNTNGIKVLPKDENAHSWIWEVEKEATCTEEGVKKAVCRWHSDATKTEAIAKADHESKGEWEVKKAATCTEEGREAICCKNCEYEFDSKVIEKIPHFASKWILDDGSSCENGGTARKVCIYPHYDENGEVVEYVMERTTFAAGTHLNRNKYTVSATCTTDGYITDTCTSCNKVFSTEYPESMKAKHTLEAEWSVIRDASCEEKGLEIRKCTRCDYSEQRDIPTYEHQYVVINEELPATCTKGGYTTEFMCLVCKTKLPSEKTEAIGHKDANNDGCCDNCYLYFVDVDGSVVECSCFCHNKDTLSQFLFKIFNFIYKLLGIKQTCECGRVHYEGTGLFG